MRPDRFVLSDLQWSMIAPLLPGKASDCGVTARDNRLFLRPCSGGFAPARPGGICRLASALGTAFSDGFAVGQSPVFSTAFSMPCLENWFEYILIDGHDRQCTSKGERRKRGTLDQAIGRSKGGLTTKNLALVDALGNLVRFSLWPGQRHDSVGALDLLDGLTFAALLGDKAFDNNAMRDDLENRGTEAVIPSKADRKQPIPYDRIKYQWRHSIEITSANSKSFDP